MDYSDQTFTNSEEIIDGNTYQGCKFESCKIVYRGGTLPKINNCNFQGCNWQFEEAAERTLVFMKMVYHGMGPSGPELIESAVNLIRQPFN